MIEDRLARIVRQALDGARDELGLSGDLPEIEVASSRRRAIRSSGGTSAKASPCSFRMSLAKSTMWSPW